MMTKRTRTIIFWVFCFLFILATPLIIFYSQGYRFDWQQKKVLQTGAFYFKTAPVKADIYLNGKFKKRTSMITGSILLKNILPKTYTVEIKKEGYHSWKKELEVKERQVTEAKNIILFPENLNFTLVSQNQEKIQEIATSSDKKKTADKSNYEIWIVFLEDQQDLVKRRAGDKILLARFSQAIGKVFWLTNDYLIFNVGDKIKIAEIDDRDKLNMVDLAEFKEPEIFWEPKNKKLYILSEKKMYLLENLLP